MVETGADRVTHRVSCPPRYMHLVSAESMWRTHQCPLRNTRTAISDSPLGACALTKWCLEAHAETKQTSLSDHDTVVDAEPTADHQASPFMSEICFFTSRPSRKLDHRAPSP